MSIKNPDILFDAIKEHPLRAQGLIASVMFGTEKKFIRFQSLEDYSIIDDGMTKEIEFSLVFEILDNLSKLTNSKVDVHEIDSLWEDDCLNCECTMHS